MNTKLRMRLQLTKNLVEIIMADFDRAPAKGVKKCLRILAKELDEIVNICAKTEK